MIDNYPSLFLQNLLLFSSRLFQHWQIHRRIYVNFVKGREKYCYYYLISIKGFSVFLSFLPLLWWHTQFPWQDKKSTTGQKKKCKRKNHRITAICYVIWWFLILICDVHCNIYAIYESLVCLYMYYYDAADQRNFF